MNNSNNREKITEEFLAELRHPDPKVRANAALNASMLQDDWFISSLTTIVEDELISNEVKKYIILTLSSMKNIKATDYLLSLLSGSRDDEIISMTASVVGNLGDKRAVPLMINLLHDDKVSIRGEIAIALGRIDKEVASEILTKYLINEDEDLVISSAYILGDIGAHSTIAELKNALKYYKKLSSRNIHCTPIIEAISSAISDIQSQ